MDDRSHGGPRSGSRDRRSVADTQAYPDALILLAASLACDRRAEAAQAGYFAVAALGSLAASTAAGRLGDLPPLVAGAPGLAVTGVVAVVLARLRHWLALGQWLRERYERRVFDFPDWTASRSGNLDVGDLDTERAAAGYLAEDGRRRDRLTTWFAVDRSEPFERQVLRAQYESAETGSLARQLWALFLLAVVALATIAVTIVSWSSWPPAATELSAWITALLPLGAAALTAVQAWRFGQERSLLADEIAAAVKHPGPEPRTMALLIEERLVALRRRRVVVPAWFFRAVHPAIRPGSGPPTSTSPGVVT